MDDSDRYVGWYGTKFHSLMCEEIDGISMISNWIEAVFLEDYRDAEASCMHACMYVCIPLGMGHADQLP